MMYQLKKKSKKKQMQTDLLLPRQIYVAEFSSSKRLSNIEIVQSPTLLLCRGNLRGSLS